MTTHTAPQDLHAKAHLLNEKLVAIKANSNMLTQEDQAHILEAEKIAKDLESGLSHLKPAETKSKAHA